MKGRALCVVFLTLAAAPLFAGGKMDKKAKAETAAREALERSERITVTGRVRLVGNEPFTEFVLHDAEGRDWHLDKEGQSLLRDSDHETVTVRGTPSVSRLTYADGKDAGPYYELRAIELME